MNHVNKYLQLISEGYSLDLYIDHELDATLVVKGLIGHDKHIKVDVSEMTIGEFVDIGKMGVEVHFGPHHLEPQEEVDPDYMSIDDIDLIEDE